MFRASSCPSSGTTTTAVAASGLLSGLGDSSAVGRGRAGFKIIPVNFSVGILLGSVLQMSFVYEFRSRIVRPAISPTVISCISDPNFVAEMLV